MRGKAGTASCGLMNFLKYGTAALSVGTGGYDIYQIGKENYQKYVVNGEKFSWGDAALDTLRITLDATSIAGGIKLATETIPYCFVAGTLVETEYGQKPIEEIQAGDKVLSENPETGEIAYKTVEETYINETDELIHVHVNDETISATPNHPFYVDKLGWTLAKNLRAGDILVLSNGEFVVVEWIQHEILENPIKVYNFEVQDFHTYFVGKSSVLVHNECTPEEAWKAIDEYRVKKDGLEPLGDSIPKRGDGKGTVAFVEVNGNKIFGINSSLLSKPEKELGKKMYEDMRKAGYFSTVKSYGSGHAQVFTHGESNALFRAYNIYGDNIGKNVTIYCDRGTCGICQTNLGYIREFLGLEKLTVINKNGKKFEF